jgi:N6-L-threonylcarbamoyladenine synthase
VPPFTALLVSGGHTLLLDVPRGATTGARRHARRRAGEAFDKVAKLLGLPYRRGGTSSAGGASTPGAHRFARPCCAPASAADDDYYDVSFSGLKTAVLAVRAPEAAARRRERGPTRPRFQDALVETLVEKTARAARGTGDARGARRRRGVQRRAAAAWRRRGRSGARVAPTPRLATDNAAMIARAGLFASSGASAPTSRSTPTRAHPGLRSGRLASAVSRHGMSPTYRCRRHPLGPSRSGVGLACWRLRIAQIS